MRYRPSNYPMIFQNFVGRREVIERFPNRDRKKIRDRSGFALLRSRLAKKTARHLLNNNKQTNKQTNPNACHGLKNLLPLSLLMRSKIACEFSSDFIVRGKGDPFKTFRRFERTGMNK